MKCFSQEDAGKAYRALHGCWFDGKFLFQLLNNLINCSVLRSLKNYFLNLNYPVPGKWAIYHPYDVNIKILIKIFIYFQDIL